MISFTVAVVQDTRVMKNDGTFSIKLRLTHNRKRFYLPINLSLTVEDWQKTQSKSPRGAFKDLKFRFDDIESLARKTLENMPNFSFERFKKEFWDTADSETDVLALMTRYIAQMQKEDRYRTATSYISSRESFKSFAIDGRTKHIPFEDITVGWLQNYEKWMLSEGKSSTTVGVYTRNLRAIFNMAIKEGLCQKDDYPFGKGAYVIPAGRKVKKALTTAQLKKLFDYTPTSTLQEKARDEWLFIYLCNGINVKDLAYLRYGNIDGDQLQYVRAKTARTTRHARQSIVVSLLPEAIAIIEKWGNPSKKPQSLIFQMIDESTTLEYQSKTVMGATRRINNHMKKIGVELGFPLKVTTYTARHSYATVLKRSGASTEFISESLGHQDLKTTESYLDSFESDVKREFQKKLLDFKDAHSN